MVFGRYLIVGYLDLRVLKEGTHLVQAEPDVQAHGHRAGSSHKQIPCRHLAKLKIAKGSV